jgi:hypothetical protein
MKHVSRQPTTKGFTLEEAMSKVVTEVRRHRMSAWAVVIAGGAIATLVGLATVESVLFTAIDAEARVAATQSPPVAPLTVDVAAGSLAIVPSPVIDTNPVFFFGTGDGSAGYYAENPTSKPTTKDFETASNAD